MRAEFINAFLKAAIEVLAGETGLRVDRGSLTLRPSTSTSHDVNALVEISGERIGGMVLVGMTTETALALLGKMLDQHMTELDELTRSGIAELTDVIATRACGLLDSADYSCTTTPATFIAGTGAQVSTLTVQSVVVPLHLLLGTVELQVALTERGSAVVAHT
jgi:chemotaxis protein CheX